MRYLVTGATGFVGEHLVHQLVDEGHDVVAFVRSPQKATALPEAVEVAFGDVTDEAKVHEAMAGSDGVFHLAGWYRIGGGDERTAERVNVEGTRNVLERMRELGISKGVYTSSLAVVSDTRGERVDESYRYEGRHRSVYDRTKWRAQYAIAEPMIEAGLPLVVVMPGAVYGPPKSTARAPNALHRLWQRYLRGELPFVIRTGTACWDHVVDCARAHRLAMDHGEPGETYIIAGESRSFVEMFDLAESLTGIPVPRTVSPRWFRSLAPVAARIEGIVPLPEAVHPETLYRLGGMTWIGDNSKATAELGLEHRPIDEGLRDYLEWERTRIDDRLENAQRGELPRPGESG